jgi:predicted dehydrogenase
MDIWLIGTGEMGIEHARVLSALKANVIAIGRGNQSASIFEEKTGIRVIRGGLDSFLATNPPIPDAVVVALPIDVISSETSKLLAIGIKRILVEKPAGLNAEEIIKLERHSNLSGASVFVAYNRRFYTSVIEARKIILANGGLSSFNFEFTEWSHVIEKTNHSVAIKRNFFFANSSHVTDLAFFLGGKPIEIWSVTNGSMFWHPCFTICRLWKMQQQRIVFLSGQLGCSGALGC